MSGGGGCWRTLDGGQTWQKESLPRPSSLNAVDMVSDTCGWAVGMSGRILNYSASTDTTPPTVTAAGFDALWHNHGVNVRLAATDVESGVHCLWWSLNSDPTHHEIGGSTGLVNVPARADHSRDGDNTLWYWGEDMASNVPDPVTTHCHVLIDTRKPTTKAPSAATAYRGKTATLRYEVVDATPNGGTATATIKVKNRAGTVVKTLSYTGKSVNTLLAAKFTVPRTWRAGTYRFYVYAKDRAGNTQATPLGVNHLYVR